MKLYLKNVSIPVLKRKKNYKHQGFYFGMALFGKKKEKTLDFTNRMVRQRERAENIREGMRARPVAAGPRTQIPQSSTNPESSNSFNASGNSFGFLDNASSYNQPSYSQPSYDSSGSGGGEDADEKKRKLAKRLMDITDKLEEISNQVYHLQQRIDLLEKKTNTSGHGY